MRISPERREGWAVEQARVWLVGSRLFSELGRKGRYVVYTPARERERERAGGRRRGPAYIRGSIPEWVPFFRTETQDHNSLLGFRLLESGENCAYGS